MRASKFLGLLYLLEFFVENIFGLYINYTPAFSLNYISKHFKQNRNISESTTTERIMMTDELLKNNNYNSLSSQKGFRIKLKSEDDFGVLFKNLSEIYHTTINKRGFFKQSKRKYLDHKLKVLPRYHPKWLNR